MRPSSLICDCNTYAAVSERAYAIRRYIISVLIVLSKTFFFK